MRTRAITAILLAIPILTAQTPAPNRNPGNLRDLSASFEQLAAKVRPSVVQIFATGYAPSDESEEGTNTSVLTKQVATGTGVILGEDGYIVTNNHVVQGARKIEVKLPMTS